MFCFFSSAIFFFLLFLPLYILVLLRLADFVMDFNNDVWIDETEVIPNVDHLTTVTWFAHYHEFLKAYNLMNITVREVIICSKIPS